jgi:putative two-component system response regulator
LKVVFVIDDRATNLMIANEALKNTYKVLTIPSADKMFKLLEKILPEVILLDIEMPEMNGFETIKKLKSDERYKSIPVIFLTGNYDEKNKNEAFSLGAVDLIVKPFSNEKLLEAVSAHVG